MRPKLSILIPTLPSRSSVLAQLLKSLEKQLSIISPLSKIDENKYSGYTITRYEYGPEVEVIVCLDNKKITVGKKRNILKAYANGEYITFVDDDDKLADDYVKLILERIESKPDLIVFRAEMFEDGKKLFNVIYHPRYSKDFNSFGKHNGVGIAYRVPNHLMVWRKEIVKYIDFPNINVGEDAAWALRCRGRVQSVQVIDRVLYYYYFDSQKTETQRR